MGFVENRFNGIENMFFESLFIVAARQERLCERRIHIAVAPLMNGPFVDIAHTPLYPERIVHIVGYVNELFGGRMVVNEVIILVIVVIIPMPNQNLGSEGLQIAIYIKNSFYILGEAPIVFAVVNDVDERHEPTVIVEILVGFEVVCPFAFGRGVGNLIFLE